MTDFDTEMMREEKPPLPVPADKDPLREPPRLLADDPALSAAMAARERDDRPEPAAEPAKAAAPEMPRAAIARQEQEKRPAPAATDPEAQAVAARKEDEARARAHAEAKSRSAAQDMDSEARHLRARLLTRALAALLQAPEAVQLDPLLTAFATVAGAEAAQAADAIVALYLRSGADLRRRMRPVLATAVGQGPEGALARALAARLGALAMPAAAPPPPPPPPPPPGG